MLTILKKEFKSYMRRTTGYVYIALLMLSVGIFVSAYNLYYGSTKLEYALTGVSIALAFSLPLFTMNIFAKDRERKTDRLLYALPFTARDVVFGKYGALLCFFGIEIAILAVVPVLLSIAGDVYFASAYLSLLCFAVFGCAMIAMNLFIACASKNNAISAIVSYAATLGAFVLYLVPTGASGIWKSVALTLRFLSPFSHLDKFLFGKFELGSIVYLLVLSALFLALALHSYERKRIVATCGKKAPELKKSFKLSPALALILAVCTVCAGTLVSFAPARYSSFDMTPNKTLSLSSSTKDFLDTIEEEADIYVINPDSSDKMFERILECIDGYSDKIDVHFGTETEFADVLTPLGWDPSYTLSPYMLVIQSELRAQVVDYATMFFYEVPDYPDMGMMSEETYLYYYQTLMQYATQDANYQQMLQSFMYNVKIHSGVEQTICQNLEYVTSKTIPQPYYLVGHGELAAAESNLHSALASLMGAEYAELDLSTASELPEDASCLIINAPKSDFSESEAKLVSDYLANGGAMILITNEENLAMKNLMSVVEAYGVSGESGLVCIDEVIEETTESESETSEEATEETADEVSYDKYSVNVAISATHASLAQIATYGSSVRNANNIKIAEGLRGQTVITPIFTTSAEAYIDNVENSKGAKTLAVAIESEVEGGVTEIMWFTGAESFEGSTLNTMNAYAVAYSVLWCYEGFEPTADETVSLKLMENAALSMRSSARLALAALIIIIIPALIVVLGLLMNRKRKAALKKTVAVAAPVPTEPMLDVADAEVSEDTEEANEEEISEKDVSEEKADDTTEE